MDKIIINDLEVFCNHGVYPEENKLGQKFFVSAVLYTDTREAGLTDDLKKTVSYGKVSHIIYDFLKQNTYKLIEKAAEELAAYLLKNIPALGQLEIEIKKPWAPIGLSINYVSVKIERGWHTAYIGLGSNMGDRYKNIENAVESIKNEDNIKITKLSEMIITKPYGTEDREDFLNGCEDFLNGCMEIRTLFTPMELLRKLNKIETDAKRERTQKWGPRTLDLDILLYDDLIIDTPELTIPHYDMQNRDFVLGPLSTIAPYKFHPVLMKTIKQLKTEHNI